jgi:hypothetical protein
MKSPLSLKTYMHDWTLRELLAVRKHISTVLSEEDVRQRFAEVGGIVRHVFTKDYADVLCEQEDRVKELSLEKLIDQDLAHASVGRSGVSNYVFKYDVTDPLVRPPLRFTSLRVIELVRKRAKNTRDLSIVECIESKCLFGIAFISLAQLTLSATPLSRLLSFVYLSQAL